MLNFSRKKKVTLRVPATMANIGPGFDSFGCAVSLYNKFTFELTGTDLAFSGVHAKYANDTNMAYQAYVATMKRIGQLSERGIRITIESDIPICRGLGSSASLLVAGAVAANELHGRPLSNKDILEIATEMEGHPDNIAPAIIGGLTASMMDEGVPFTVKYTVASNIHPIVIIPDFELSTAEARAALPKQVPFNDAVFNISHAALLLRALELGDENIIRHALSDKLHQPYRKSLIQGYEEVESAAMSLGAISYCISGAGPTQLAIVTQDPEKFVKALSTKICVSHPGWKVMSLSIDNEGAKIL